MTWGHNDKRLFVSTGNQIHVGWVSPQVASLQLLARLSVHRTLSSPDKVHLLPLPCRLQNLIGMLFAKTIRVRNSLMKKDDADIVWVKASLRHESLMEILYIN